LQSHISTDDIGEQLDVKRVKSTVASTLLTKLDSDCKAYCVLSGYDNLPDSFETDIDFMVNSHDFERVPSLVADLAQQTGTKLFHTVGHELTARAFSLGFQSGDKLIIVQPDSSADYRHYGLLWLHADEVLAARRRHPRGFWIPSAAHEFTYYLIKRLNKRHLSDEHGQKLHRLYAEDPAGCGRMIARFWKGRNRTVLARMAESNDWTDLATSFESVRSELMQNSAETLVERIKASPMHAMHHLNRVLNPTGGWIAIMGPDGAGKSAVINAIRQQFAIAYNGVKCFHLRPKILRPGTESRSAVTDPHGQPPRGLFLSVAKIFFLIADYWLGYLLKIAPEMRRSRFFVFDRYLYDLLVDSKRVRYSGPAWMLRVAARVIPHPDLVILLDAPPEVLWSRKQEVPFEEVARQRESYRAVTTGLSFAKIVDAAQPLEDVIRDVDSAIVEYYERRTAKRLGLEPSEVLTRHKPMTSPTGPC
jgi:thymidylate kinase